MTPSAIQAVFREHGCGVLNCWTKTKPSWSPGQNVLEIIPCPKLLDELAALEPVKTLDRQQVIKVITDHIIGLRLPEKDGSYRGMVSVPDLADAICSLALPEAQEPSREELIKILEEHLIGVGKAIKDYTLIDLLMSWASRNPREKKWCDHIAWKSYSDGRSCWRISEGGSAEKCADGYVANEWTACPICSAPRPTQS